jgi:outer membrane protein assembly factor BamB
MHITHHLLSFALLLGASATCAADWPMLGRDQTRNPVSPEKNPPLDWDVQSGRNIKWKAPLGLYTFSDPVISDGLVWIGSSAAEHPAGILNCFRESDGQLLYQHRTPWRPGVMRPGYLGVSCSPLVEKDRLWFTTILGEVIALDIGPLLRGEGEPVELWKLDMLDELGVFPAIAYMGDSKTTSIAASYKGLIYVITGNGLDWSRRNVPAPHAPSLICLNKETGELVWEDDSPGANIIYAQWASPLVMEINGRGQVIAPQGDGWIRSFDALTGELIWKFDINSKKTENWHRRNYFLNTPVFYEDRVYVGSGQEMENGEGPGRLVCINPMLEGDLSLELEDDQGNIRANPNSGAVWHYDGIGRTRSNVAIQDGLLIAADFSGDIHCLDAGTGQVYWKESAREHLFGSPLIVDGKVYVTTGWDGELVILELSRETKIVARHAMGGFAHASPVFANGVLYVAAGEFLYAIEEPAQVYDWPQWRGPDRSNLSLETGLLKKWPPEGPPLEWTVTGLGDGIASVAIQHGRLVTLRNKDEMEHVIALDALTGELQWAASLAPATRQSPLMRWLSPRTPTLDGERVYALSSGGDLVCLQALDGKLVWRKSYTEHFLAQSHTWGFCDYMLVDGEKLIVTPGGPDASVAALNKYTGEVLWKSLVPEGGRAAYAATLVTAPDGVRQYVTFLQGALVGIDATHGGVLWRYDRTVDSRANSYTPIVRGDRVISANGYRGTMASIRLFRDEAENFQLEEEYFVPANLDPFQDCTVPVGDYLYTWLRANAAACFDMRTGRQVWGPGEGRGVGRAAVTGADGHLYYLRSDGQLLLVEASPEGYREKGSFRIPDYQQAIGASFPVVANGRLYIRDNDRLHCYDVREDALDRTRALPATVAMPLAAPIQAPEKRAEPLLRSGRTTAPSAIYVPTPNDVVSKMLGLAEVQETDLVLDLGSGDGRIVIAAAREYGALATGYEIDLRLVELARLKVAQENLEQRAQIVHQDIFTLDLSQADVIAVYLPSPLLERLLPQFKKLKPGARIVSHQFEIPGVPPDQSLVIDSMETGDKHRLFLWTAPLQKPSVNLEPAHEKK